MEGFDTSWFQKFEEHCNWDKRLKMKKCNLSKND